MKPPASINRILDIGPSVTLKTYTENGPKPNLFDADKQSILLYRRLSFKPTKLIEISRLMGLSTACRIPAQFGVTSGWRRTLRLLNARYDPINTELELGTGVDRVEFS